MGLPARFGHVTLLRWSHLTDTPHMKFMFNQYIGFLEKRSLDITAEIEQP